jgi:hypothetical protein
MDDFSEEVQIAILNVATILSKVNDDPVRPGRFHQYGCGNRVRVVSSPGLAQGGDVIDVNA